STDLNTGQDLLELQNYIQVALDRVKTDPNPELYAYLKAAIETPEWNGLIALNCLVPTIPDQASGLSFGLDKSLRADHFGLEITQVNADGDLSLASSSMFGLIHQLDDSPPEKWANCTSAAEICFHVSEITVLFGNSEVKDFRCKM